MTAYFLVPPGISTPNCAGVVAGLFHGNAMAVVSPTLYDKVIFCGFGLLVANETEPACVAYDTLLNVPAYLTSSVGSNNQYPGF